MITISYIYLMLLIKKDVTDNMLKTDYICYYSLFHDVEGHDVSQHINEVISTGIQLDQELVS